MTTDRTPHPDDECTVICGVSWSYRRMQDKIDETNAQDAANPVTLRRLIADAQLLGLDMDAPIRVYVAEKEFLPLRSVNGQRNDESESWKPWFRVHPHADVLPKSEPFPPIEVQP